jgi:hypothetical protein
MVTLTSNTTNVCDASITIIYRANSPTIYARVNELEFHCIYCQPMLLVEFSLYILNQVCLRTKPKHEAQFPSNHRNFSPIGIHCQNGWKGVRRGYDPSVLDIGLPGSCQGRSPLEGYMKPTRPSTLTWGKRQKILVNPNWLHI